MKILSSVNLSTGNGTTTDSNADMTIVYACIGGGIVVIIAIVILTILMLKKKKTNNGANTVNEGNQMVPLY